MAAPEAKRQRRTRDAVLSSMPDLQVIVEEETFEAHTLILATVSPVFRQMLNTSMSEGLWTQVKLPGKSKEEFKEFLDILQPKTTTKLTEKNVVFLSCWADEYQVETLKTSCEEFLMKTPCNVQLGKL